MDTLYQPTNRALITSFLAKDVEIITIPAVVQNGIYYRTSVLVLVIQAVEDRLETIEDHPAVEIIGISLADDAFPGLFESRSLLDRNEVFLLGGEVNEERVDAFRLTGVHSEYQVKAQLVEISAYFDWFAGVSLAVVLVAFQGANRVFVSIAFFAAMSDRWGKTVDLFGGSRWVVWQGTVAAYKGMFELYVNHVIKNLLFIIGAARRSVFKVAQAFNDTLAEATAEMEFFH